MTYHHLHHHSLANSMSDVERPDEMNVSKGINVAKTLTDQSIRQTKKALRKRMAVELNKIPAQEIIQQSLQVTKHVLQHPAYQNAKKVSIYVSMEKGEIRTEELCKQTLLLGKKLYVPRFAKPASGITTSSSISTTQAAQQATFDSDMRMLRVNHWNDFEAMVMNKWGIREPEESYLDERREDALDESTGGNGLDLILVPGVAFDLSGGRLGHGKGYYDRYITKSQEFANKRGLPDVLTVALALKEQILPENESVPCDERDVNLTSAISPNGAFA